MLLFPNWTRVSAAARARGHRRLAGRAARADAPAPLRDGPADRRRRDQQRGHGRDLLRRVAGRCGSRRPDRTSRPRSTRCAPSTPSRNLWDYKAADAAPMLAACVAGRAADCRVELGRSPPGTARTAQGSPATSTLVVDSHLVGVEKPDPAIFHGVLRRCRRGRGRRRPRRRLLHHRRRSARGPPGCTPVLLDPAGLHEGRDCVRIAALRELPGLLERGAAS